MQAHKWLNRSIAQGDKEAGPLRDELAKTMTQDQIVEEQNLTREWTMKNN